MMSPKAMSAEHAGYYLGLAREDYYLKGGEPQGLWYGRGAAALGLEGYVLPDHLYNLFDGLAPNGSVPLVQLQDHRDSASHLPGWDLTFSAPKSVSVLWSQASPELRKLVQEAHLAAVKASLDYLQETAAFSRHGKEGKYLHKTKLVVALFEHSTSRALDPQLHTHALVMNIGVGNDGKTRTVSGLHFFAAKMASGAIYRAELSSQLEKLGLHCERFRSWFEVEGVSEELVDLFSKRRKDIEKELQDRGLNSPIAAAVAAIETRSPKEAVARGVLFEGWQADGRELGWTTSQADALFGSFRPSRDVQAEIADAARLAVGRLMASQAHFTERDFVRFMAEEAQGRGLGAAVLLEGATRFLATNEEILRLGRYHGEDRFTTREMLQLEQSLLATAQTLRNDWRHQVSVHTFIREVSSFNAQLSVEQLKAVEHICVDTGAISVVSGMAGAGKTRMLHLATQTWKAEGFQVLGTALSDQACGVLALEAGVETLNVAKLLFEVEKGRNPLSERTVLILDEAGMVATPEMERLARAC